METWGFEEAKKATYACDVCKPKKRLSAAAYRRGSILLAAGVYYLMCLKLELPIA
jgi:hypothetical protein